MSANRIVTAMRSGYSPAVRLVWQCLESHANDIAEWTATCDQIASELTLGIATVKRAMRLLHQDGVVRVVHNKRRPSTICLLPRPL